MREPASKRLIWVGGAASLIFFFACLVVGQSLIAPIFGLVTIVGFSIYARTHLQLLEETIQTNEENLSRLSKTTETQRATLDAFADGLDLGIFVCDSRGQIQYANKFVRDLFGFENPSGRTLLSVTLSVELEQLALRCSEEPGPFTTEITFNFPTERTCQARAWVTDEEESRVYLSLLDVTDLRRLERIRKDFVANVSHELRTPMTVIRAYAETMLDNDSADVRTNYLERIIQEVDRLSNIAQDLLILSTAESSLVRKAPCDLGEILQYSFNLLFPKAQAKNLSMTYSGPQNLHIEANANQVTQVVMNLIENSIKYTSEGGIEICLEEANGYARLDISDSGIGIATEHLSRLFERFYRVDKGRSRASGGTGLGLSIVKHIVEAHGGTVTVDSTLNIGSTFTVMLPIGEVGQKEVPTTTPEPAQSEKVAVGSIEFDE